MCMHMTRLPIFFLPVPRGGWGLLSDERRMSEERESVLRTNPLKKDTGRYSGSQVVRCEPPHPPPVPLVRSTLLNGRHDFLLPMG